MMWNSLYNLNYYQISLIIILLYMISNGNGQHFGSRRTSNTCISNENCPLHAFCQFNAATTGNGQCICEEGYLIARDNKIRECFKVAQQLGDSCLFDEQCMFRLSTESECKDGICQCQDGTHFVAKENTCYKSVKVGDFCRLTNNCIGEGTVCRSGFCHCPIETHANADFTGCLKDAQLGDLCTVDKECVALNSRCHDICRCKVSHVISQDKLRCIKIAEKIFDECEEDNQCQAHIAHSICGDNNTCVCKENYHELNYQCWVSVQLRGICEANENCALVSNAVCLEGYCQCKTGLQELYGQCSNGIPVSINIILINFIATLSIFFIILNNNNIETY